MKVITFAIRGSDAFTLFITTSSNFPFRKCFNSSKRCWAISASMYASQANSLSMRITSMPREQEWKWEGGGRRVSCWRTLGDGLNTFIRLSHMRLRSKRQCCTGPTFFIFSFCTLAISRPTYVGTGVNKAMTPKPTSALRVKTMIMRKTLYAEIMTHTSS